MTVLLDPTKVWECRLCGARDRTSKVGVHVQYHHCLALGGVNCPMTDVSAQPSRTVLVERQDFIGAERGVTMIDGRAVMAIRTERVDGSNDCVVLPGIAYADAEAVRAAQETIGDL